MNTYPSETNPFGGGRIFFAALTLMRENFLILAGIAFLMYLALWTATSVVEGLLGISGTFLSLLFGPVISGVLLLIAADLLANRPVQIRPHFERVMKSFAPLVILQLCASIAVVLGTFVFIIPGLYLAGVFLVLIPVIIFEDAGWEGLKKSWTLSQPHVWPIVGIMLRLFVLGFVLFFVLVLVTGNYFLPQADGEPIEPPILLQGVFLFGTSCLAALSVVLSLMVYHRLRGTDDGPIERVFE